MRSGVLRDDESLSLPTTLCFILNATPPDSHTTPLLTGEDRQKEDDDDDEVVMMVIITLVRVAFIPSTW